MNLLDLLKLSSAAAMDGLHEIASTYGAQARISVVISRPGSVEDSFVVGEHEPAELFAILQRLETGPAVECDVTSTMVGENEPSSRSIIQ